MKMRKHSVEENQIINSLIKEAESYYRNYTFPTKEHRNLEELDYVNRKMIEKGLRVKVPLIEGDIK
tara:strand:+ start:896 stop:1093 length:198 start_codon:yes stop_codon:yes gene_type:complete